MSGATALMNTAAMTAELRITFPGLRARPLSEFGQAYAGREGIWTGQDAGHDMPGGDPIFNSLANGEAPYNGAIHEGFEAWLAARGWWVERYDGATYFLLPESAL